MLRQKVTTDIATKGGQYDVLTIGTYEVPIWAKQDWLVRARQSRRRLRRQRPAAGHPRRPVGSTASSTPRRSTARARYVMYRKDLMEKAGLTMPDAPTWDFIRQGAPTR